MTAAEIEEQFGLRSSCALVDSIARINPSVGKIEKAYHRVFMGSRIALKSLPCLRGDKLANMQHQRDYMVLGDKVWTKPSWENSRAGITAA